MADADRLSPGEAIAGLAAATLDRLADWTSSQAELDQALSRAMERPAGGLHRLIEGRHEGTLVETRQQASRLMTQVENAVAAASSSMRAEIPTASPCGNSTRWRERSVT